MLDSLKIKLVWSIIEREKAVICPKSSDCDIVSHITNNLKAIVSLSAAEQCDTDLYIRSRTPLIRDLAEIQAARN